MDSEQVSGARHSRAPHFCASDLFSGLTNFAELEQRIADLPTRQERGEAFEVFAEAYLATQKVNQASEVWPHNAVPISIADSLKLPPKDMGSVSADHLGWGVVVVIDDDEGAGVPYRT